MFTQNFLADLSYLPADIANPSTTSSWSEYEWFLNKYGSHIVSKVYLGARLEHFATAESSSSYDESDFKARLCLDVEGLTPGKVFTVNGCNSFSKERREEAKQYNMRTVTHIRGGDPLIRSKLHTNLDPTTVEELIESASSFPNPIKYEFMPIWKVLQSLGGPDEETYYKALNLHAYYSGFRGFQCEERKSPSGKFILPTIYRITSA